MISLQFHTRGSVLSWNGRPLMKATLPECTKRWAKIYLRLRFDAPIRDRLAMLMGAAVIASAGRQLVSGSVPGASAGLSQLTIGAKRAQGYGAKALVGSGRLARGLKYRKTGVGRGMVYYPNNAWTGRSAGTARSRLGLVASVHEFGDTMVVTERMEKAFKMAVLKDGWPVGFLKLKQGMTLTIRPRPFFTPGVLASADEVNAIVGEVLMRIIESAAVDRVATLGLSYRAKP